MKNGKVDKQATIAYKKRGIYTPEEIDLMLTAADTLPTEYFRLRAKCLVSLFKKFGKRRSEISRLALADIQMIGNDLEVTFNLSKKHKKGLFQYMKHLEKSAFKDMLLKPLPEIKQSWRDWQQTQAGHTIKNSQSLQSISLDDKYTPYILEYMAYLKKYYPEAKFLFPSGLTVFGNSYVVFPEDHLSGSQLLRILKPLCKTGWLHLFRETKGAEIAKAHGRTLTSVYEVKDGLDLENEETAYRYVRRYAAKRQEVEK